MTNAWSLLYDELYGDKEMTDENKITPQESDEYDPIIGTGNTAYDPTHGYPMGKGIGYDLGGAYEYEHSDMWYDYNRNDDDATNPFTDPLDYARAESVVSGAGTGGFPYDYDTLNLNIHANSPYNDGWTRQEAKEELAKMTDSRNKYHEDEILKDIKDYVSGTYNGQYTGTKHEYRNVLTLDLMASRDLASSFCQSNILKYGSRYGSKDGKNKKDLMKVIHYAMLLLHFDEHYGKPSMTSGNIDHNMP